MSLLLKLCSIIFKCPVLFEAQKKIFCQIQTHVDFNVTVYSAVREHTEIHNSLESPKEKEKRKFLGLITEPKIFTSNSNIYYKQIKNKNNIF